jgi:hypothetical protein
MLAPPNLKNVAALNNNQTWLVSFFSILSNVWQKERTAGDYY